MSILEDTLHRMVAVFNSLHIPYAVMGGLAVRIHGLPRPTHDVDFTVSLERARLAEWFAEVERAGFTVPDTYRKGWVDQVADLPVVKLVAHLPDGHGIDVDVFLAESDYQTELLLRAVEVVVDDFAFRVVTPEDLVLLKLIANRPRDLLDIHDILFVQGRLDEAYLEHWAGQLGISSRLASVLHGP